MLNYMRRIIKKVKQHKKKVAVASIALAVGLAGFGMNAGIKPQLPERKIIIFEDYILNDQFKEIVIANAGAKKIKNLKLVNGAVISLPDKALEARLKNAPGVKRIENDAVAMIMQGRSAGRGSAPSFVENIKQIIQDIISSKRPFDPGKAPDKKPEKTKEDELSEENSTSTQIVPWGIERIGAGSLSFMGEGVKLAIIDTGVEVIHPDLIDNIKGGISTVSYTASYSDDNGHGTHVAGTVAALSNNFGVLGAASKAQIYSIKALEANGSGYLSDIIEGIDWAIANRVQIVNMSLGTTANIQSFHEAIKKAHASGIIIVAAAGNDGGPVNYPAAYPEVVAVSALDQNNSLTSWSSRGQEIMFSAPGLQIPSTYKGKTYADMSGTSMASPHVAGAVAVLKSANPFATRERVLQSLKDGVLDLGIVGRDDLYGWGLINLPDSLNLISQ